MSADTSRHPVEELAEEFVARYRRGEQPAVSEYTSRYPDWADEIRDVFPALLLMEDGRPAPARGSDTPLGTAVPTAAPSRLGDFQIVREIGRGGMGVVYEAVQESLGRRVALKVLPATLAEGPVLRARFQREAQAAARLHHTNIVPIFGVGEDAGVPYFAMQLIEGPGLAHVLHGLRRDGLPPGVDHFRRVARLGVQAAEALAHAHGQGLVHRDIKPSNLLLDGQDTLWVMDFGLAQAEGLDALTETGDLVGTLRYLAPERFHRSADARSDQYSLGLTLYELLTLRPAFDGDERGPLVRQVMQGDVVPPRRLSPAVPRDLETILLTCLRKEPERRYASAAALAEDLRRFLDDRPILARRLGPLGRAWRWCRRNPALAGLSGVTVLALLALLGVSLRHNVYLGRALQTAENERTAARRAEQDALDNVRKASQAVDRMLTRVGHGKLRGVPQAEPVRRELLQEALGFYEGFLAQYADDPRLRHEAGQVLCHLGDAQHLLGDLKAAEVAYGRAEELLEGMVSANQGPAAVRGDLAAASNQHGLLLYHVGRFADAEERYRRASGLYEGLAAEFPQSVQHRTSLLTTAINRANVLVQTGRRAEAVSSYEQMLEEARRLAADFPTDADALHNACNAFFNLGNLLVDGGRPAEAEARVEEALGLARRMCQTWPQEPGYRLRLAAACNQLGIVRRARKGPSAAAEALREAIVLYEALTADFPSTPDYASELGGALNNLALLAGDRADWPETRRLAEQAVRWQQAAREISPQRVIYRRFLRNHLSVLTGALLRLGDHIEAARAAEQWAEVRPEPANDFYNAACTLGQCIPLANQNTRLSADERRRLSDGYADRAMVHLRASVQAGLKALPHLVTDPDLQPLRSRADFQELVRALSKKAP